MTLEEFFKEVPASVLAAKIVFKKLEESYSLFKISEIAKTTSGGTPSRSMPDYYNGTIPWVKSGELKDTYITDSEEYITEKGLKNSSAKLFPKGTLLVAMYGANIGKTGILDFEASTNQAVCAVFPKNKISTDYLFWFFKQKRIDFIARGKGGAQPNISQAIIRDTTIAVPNENIQAMVVDFLNKIDDEKGVDTTFFLSSTIDDINKLYNFRQNYISLTQSVQNQSTLLDQLEQAILQEAVQGKLVPQNPEDEPASVLLERIKAEKKEEIRVSGRRKPKALPPIKDEEIPFAIPESWVWCRLGDVIEYTDNLDIQKYLPADTIIHYVDIDAIDNVNYVIREPKIKTVSELSSRARRVLKKGYILYSTVRPYLKNIAIIDDEKENFIGSTGFNVFKTYQCDLKYIFYFLLSPYLNRAFEDLMVGFNSPSITNVQFENCVIPLPPLAEQQRIVEEVERQLERVKKLKELVEQNQEETEKLLKALLQEAFSSGDE